MRRRHTHLSLDLTLSLIFSALLAAWVATELFAFSVHFPTALGAHYSYLYPPWSIAIWWSWWHTDHPTFLNTSVALGAVAGGLLCFSSITSALQRRASLRAYDDVHGTARWARLADIQRAGLLSPLPASMLVHGKREESSTCSATTVPNTCCVTPQADQAKALAWSYRRCSPGRIAPLRLTLKARSTRSQPAGEAAKVNGCCALNRRTPPHQSRGTR